MVEILIDSREPREVKDSFALLAAEKGFTIDSSKQLPCGDFCYGDIFIERKEASDFDASILDGRLSRQTTLMNENNCSSYVIVEGHLFKENIFGSEDFITKKRRLIGAQISLVTERENKKPVKVIHTDDVHGTCYAVWKIVDKYMHNTGRSVELKLMKRGNTEVSSGVINSIAVLTDDTGKWIGPKKASTIVADFGIKNFQDVVMLRADDYETLRKAKKLKGVTKKDILVLKKYC